MGDGMSDGYNDHRRWRKSVDNLRKMEKQALAESSEYQDLIDAHIAISTLIRQQTAVFNDIQEKRHEVLKAYWPEHGGVADLADIDAELGRNVISKWALRDLIK